MARVGQQRHGGKKLSLKRLQENHVDDILDAFLAVVYNQNTSANGQANLNSLASVPFNSTMICKMKGGMKMEDLFHAVVT